MARKREYRSLNEIDEAYYRDRPEEIDSYLNTAFEEYAKDGCAAWKRKYSTRGIHKILAKYKEAVGLSGV